jgi:hypothetical protein
MVRSQSQITCTITEIIDHEKDYKPWKGLFTRNSHMKYQSPSAYHSNDVAKVEVLNK